MPIKILLADKSITIQKVVEMLFSGKDYEVLCVSDGETALSEAARIVPDVVLADIDLPRVDGYAFSGRLKQTPALAHTPVILMMSRDDVFDQGKAKQVSIVDHIAKPFESQELISKVKKAVSAAPQRTADIASTPVKTPGPKPAQAPVPPPPQRPAAPPPLPKPKQTPPTDIFDIIDDAPTQADLKRPPAAALDEDAVYEVEPVVEVEEEPVSRDLAKTLPVGAKAVEEMREGLGLTTKNRQQDEDIISFESLDMGTVAQKPKQPPRIEKPLPEAREWTPPVTPPEPAPAGPQIAFSPSDLWNMAEETVSKLAREMFEKMQPPRSAAVPEADIRAMVEQAVAEHEKGSYAGASSQPPQISDDMLRSMVAESVQQSLSGIVKEIAGEIIEKVAWEVVPDLAAAMIRAEIERLKAEQ